MLVALQNALQQHRQPQQDQQQQQQQQQQQHRQPSQQQQQQHLQLGQDQQVQCHATDHFGTMQSTAETMEHTTFHSVLHEQTGQLGQLHDEESTEADGSSDAFASL